MRDIATQLSQARRDSGLSVAELLKRTALPLTRASLQRKLSGDLPLKIGEAESVAKALGSRLVLMPRAA